MTAAQMMVLSGREASLLLPLLYDTLCVNCLDDTLYLLVLVRSIIQLLVHTVPYYYGDNGTKSKSWL